MKNDKIVLATGGTGGHVFPAIALAEELISRSKQVSFITDSRGEKYLKNSGYEYFVTAIKGGKKLSIFIALFQALFFLVKTNPALIVGFGGYPAFPPLFVGKIMGKKIFIHEQNSVLGKVNKIFAKTNNVATSFPNVAGECVGNPVRKEITKSPLPTIEDKINILIIGGSQGAKLFSDVLPQAFLRFKTQIKVTQQVVPAEVEHIKSFYKVNKIEAEVAPFFSDMPRRYAECHLVISRSGSSTIFELAAAERPAIFVPLAIAADNHQYINAVQVAKIGGGWIIAEKDFTPDEVAKVLGEIIAEPKKLADAAKNIANFAAPDAAKKLADFILK